MFIKMKIENSNPCGNVQGSTKKEKDGCPENDFDRNFEPALTYLKYL